MGSCGRQSGDTVVAFAAEDRATRLWPSWGSMRSRPLEGGTVALQLTLRAVSSMTNEVCFS
jgi:hypothetical protein